MDSRWALASALKTGGAAGSSAWLALDQRAPVGQVGRETEYAQDNDNDWADLNMSRSLGRKHPTIGPEAVRQMEPVWVMRHQCLHPTSFASSASVQFRRSALPLDAASPMPKRWTVFALMALR